MEERWQCDYGRGMKISGPGWATEGKMRMAVSHTDRRSSRMKPERAGIEEHTAGRRGERKREVRIL